MLRLKYLFDNRDLATMILENWDYDIQSLEMFQYYRISANAIYPFRVKNKICLLRFCPAEEKDYKQISAELEFIAFLKAQGLAVLETLASKNGNEIESVCTPWGKFHASVFKRVRGEALAVSNLNEEVIREVGRTLGKLHKFSSDYKNPRNSRWTHADALNWIEIQLKSFADEEKSLFELNSLKNDLKKLPKNKLNYGLIHYDFEPDNVFWDSTSKICSIIDFDDSMYHWYATDIIQSIKSLSEKIPNKNSVQIRNLFLEGYTSEFPLDDTMESPFPILERFRNLYAYTRLKYSTQEQWKNEPLWMKELRLHLSAMEQGRAYWKK